MRLRSRSRALGPVSAKRVQLQKEKGSSEDHTRPSSEELSTKLSTIVVVHRERYHAKDESHLADLEFYFTLINKGKVSAKEAITK